jgi:hypothetical protein
VIPLAVVARLGFYFLRRMQADQQMARGVQAGEELIVPTLTVSSILAWMVLGVVLVAALYVVALIALRAHLNRRILTDWIERVVIFVALTFVVGLPFTMYFATAYKSVKPWELETTPLWAYLYVHGTFIFIVISLLVWQSARWLRAVTVRDLQGLAVPVIAVGGGLVVVIAGSLIFGVREVAVAQLVVPLMAWATLLFSSAPESDAACRLRTDRAGAGDLAWRGTGRAGRRYWPEYRVQVLFAGLVPAEYCWRGRAGVDAAQFVALECCRARRVAGRAGDPVHDRAVLPGAGDAGAVYGSFQQR